MTSRRARSTRPGIETHAPADAGPSRAWDAAAWVTIAAAAGVLAWIAFRLHTVGDYSTESDFYGGYAIGARLIQHGHVDASRYPVVGPGYEFCLALVGLVVRDLFTAARLIAVGSAVGTLLLWRAILARRAGSAVAFWTVAFLAANAVFVRYGYSATTDLPAILLQATALHAVLASEGRLAPLRSGVWAALATLTRYNSIAIVPAAILCYAALAPPTGMSRRRAIALHLAGFALVFGPWLGFSLAHGHVPAASLFGQLGSFYMVDDNSRNVQDQYAAVAESLAAARSLGRVAHDPVAMVLGVLTRVPNHLRRDAIELIGLPLAALALAGLLLARLDGAWRRLLPVWVAGALLFATLVPVFYSDRYSMAIAPAYLTLAAAAIASPRFALRIRPGGFHLKWLVGLAVLVVTIRGAAAQQRIVLYNQPLEARVAGAALARVARPDERILCRKAQVAYYSGCEAVPFPRLPNLAELGRYGARRGIDYLYYSWYDARLRPEFAYLLDTTAVVPGLALLFHTAGTPRGNPAVVYRVGPEFGRNPEWFGVQSLRRLHMARAFVQFMPDSECAPSHELLASDALERGDPKGALAYVRSAMNGRPPTKETWLIEGEALRALGRLDEAVPAYEKAVLMDPGYVSARLGLGWAQLGRGSLNFAAGVWRKAIGPEADAYTLGQMVRLYEQLGDHAAARAARDELARRGEHPAEQP